MPLFLQAKSGQRIFVSTIFTLGYFIPGSNRNYLPLDDAVDLGHQQDREFLAGCAFLKGSNIELSITTVQPGCAEHVLSSNFKCRLMVHTDNIEAVI